MSDDDPNRPPAPRPAAAGHTAPFVRRPQAPRAPPPEPEPAPADAASLVGTIVDGRYRVLERLAKGGMGEVYVAEQAPLGRRVALKVLDTTDSPDERAEFEGRFMLEAASTARLADPHTVRIYDYGRSADGLLYIAMELLTGRTLHRVLKDEGPLAPARTVRILQQVCGSLREAHALGLIHRDLKPSNVMLVPTGGDPEFVKVLDFGLVKEVRGGADLTRSDAVVGSPSYMSPEQVRAVPVDQRADLYALGVLMYACLTGAPPFSAPSAVAVLMAHLHTPPVPVEERARLERAPVLAWVVMTCLEKEPDRRFADTDELLRALRLAEAELRGEPVARPVLVNGRIAAGPPTREPARPAPRAASPGPRVLWGLGIAATLAIAIGLGLLAAGVGLVGARALMPATTQAP